MMVPVKMKVIIIMVIHTKEVRNGTRKTRAIYYVLFITHKIMYVLDVSRNYLVLRQKKNNKL